MGRSHRDVVVTITILVVLAMTGAACAQTDAPTSRGLKTDALKSLQIATQYMTSVVANHGGYAWVSSVDGKLSHGEGACDDDRVWVQPPGTPAIGEAFLKAFETTGDEVHLNAAREVGEALIRGQLHSGGWAYSIEFSDSERAKVPYRVDSPSPDGKFTITPEPGGWDVWKQRQFKTNRTTLDDDTTSAALSFLLRLRAILTAESLTVQSSLDQAIDYALQSTRLAQYPIGAWSHHYDRKPTTPPSVAHYPILQATYPATWSSTWTKDYAGCYMLNDNITQNMIGVMLLAWELTGDERCRDSAIRGGEFLLRAQMPSPQPAWAQQYDRNMHPVWDRKFEPPAICGAESQTVLATLMDLYQATGDKRFVEPIAPAIAYLRTCLRPDGDLPRYMELHTNRPLYFDQDYQLTTDDSDMPDHYGFVGSSRLDALERRLKIVLAPGRGLGKKKAAKVFAKEVTEILTAQHADGGWRQPGFVRDAEGRKVTPEEGVIDSKAFIQNVNRLCSFLAME